MPDDELSATIIGPNGFPLVDTEHALLRDEYLAWRDQNTGRHMSLAAYAKDVYFKDDIVKQPQPQPQPQRGRSGMYPDLSAAARSALPVLNKTVLAGLPVLNRFGAPSAPTREVWGMPALLTPHPTPHGDKAHKAHRHDGSGGHAMPALAHIGLPSKMPALARIGVPIPASQQNYRKYADEVATANSSDPREVFELLWAFRSLQSDGEDVVIEYKVTGNNGGITVKQMSTDVSIEVAIEEDGRRVYVTLDDLKFSFGVTSNIDNQTALFDKIARGDDFDGDSDSGSNSGSGSGSNSGSGSGDEDEAEAEAVKQLRGLVILADEMAFEGPSFAAEYNGDLSSDSYIVLKLRQAPAPVQRRSDRLRGKRWLAPEAPIGMFALFPHRRHPHNPHYRHPRSPHYRHPRNPRHLHAGIGSNVMPALAHIGAPIRATDQQRRKYPVEVDTAASSNPGEVFGLLHKFLAHQRAGKAAIIEYAVTPTRPNYVIIEEMSDKMNFWMVFGWPARRVYVTLGDITFSYGVTTQVRSSLVAFDELGEFGGVDEDVDVEKLKTLEELADQGVFSGPAFKVSAEDGDRDIDPYSAVQFTLRSVATASRAPIGMPALVSARTPGGSDSGGTGTGAHVIPMARIGEMAAAVRGHGMDAVYSPTRARIETPTLPVGFPITTTPVWKNQPGLFVTEVTDWKNVLELLSNWVAYSETKDYAKDESSELAVESFDHTFNLKRGGGGKVFGVRSPIDSLSLYVDATNTDDTGRIYIAFGIQTQAITSGPAEKKFRIPFYCSYDETSAKSFLARMKGKDTIALKFGGNGYTFDADGDYVYADDDDDDPEADPVHAMLDALAKLNPHKVHYTPMWQIPNDSFAFGSTLARRVSLRLPAYTECSGPFADHVLNVEPDFDGILHLIDTWAHNQDPGFSNSFNFAIELRDYDDNIVVVPRIANGLTLSAMVDGSKTVKMSITITKKTSFETMTTFPFIFNVKEGDTKARELFELAMDHRSVDGLACITATFPSPMFDVIRKAMLEIRAGATSNDEADIKDIVARAPSARLDGFTVTAARAASASMVTRKPMAPIRHLSQPPGKTGRRFSRDHPLRFRNSLVNEKPTVGHSFATVCDSFAKDKATIAQTVSGSRGAILAFAAELREAHAAVDSGSASRARGIRSSVLDTGALAAAAKAGPRDPKRAAFMAAASALSDHIVGDHSATAAEIRSIGVSMSERLKRLRLKPDAFVTTLAEAWKRLGQQAVKDTMGLTDVDMAYRSGVQVFAPIKRRIEILARKNPVSSRSRALAWGAVGAAILSASVKALVATPKSAKFSAKLANAIYENISGFTETPLSTQTPIGSLAVARQLKISDKVFAGLQTIVTKSIGKWEDESKTIQFAEASVVMFMSTFLAKKRELINLFMSAVAAVEILEEVTRVIAGVNTTTRTQIIEKIEPAYDMLVADSTKE